MFDFVQKHRLTIGLILGIIALTFVGFGVGSYRWSSQGGNYLAKVGHLTVTSNDFARAIERLKANGNIAVTAQIKQQVLDELIGHNLLAIEAEDQHVMVNDEQIAKIILSIPQLQEAGQFSQLRYRYLLESRRETAKEFEAAVRKQFLVQVQLSPFLAGQFIAQQQVEWLSALFSQKRIVQLAKFEPTAFLEQVQITSKEIGLYYQQNMKNFKQPEAAKVDFITVSPNKNTFISPKEVAAYYNTHQAEFEKRKISHILIQVPVQSTDTEKTQAKQKIQTLLKQLRLNPSQFSTLAKAYSQDTGSAEQGGNIGEISRGMTVKPFEEVAFALKIGEVSNIVVTQYGYHLIKVEAIRKDNFSTVKPIIVAQLQEKAQKVAMRKNGRLLAKMVYDGQSLTTIAATLKCTVQHADWLTSQTTTHPYLSQPQVLAQIFKSNIYQHQKISDVIRLNDDSLLVLQVKEKRPARTLTLKEATPTIIQLLTKQKASRLALNKAQSTLRALKHGQKIPLAWQGPLIASLSMPEQILPPAAIRRIFTTPVTVLPTYVGFKTNQNAYWLIRIDAVKTKSSTLTPAEKAQFSAQLEENFSFAQIAAYIRALRDKISIVYPSEH
ncbi:MAG: SurA N-terminal domain-containing protein [Neisseriales bacterium]|nr:MAG: SurA N-terminal domain-containing protein [Neisseriales bacterium]